MATKKAKIKSQAVNRRETKAALKQKPMLDLFVMALAELYPHDKVAPGITIAYLPAENLPAEQKFYASVCRYNGSPAQPENKEVLYAVRGNSTLEVVQALAHGWFDKNQAAQQFALKVRRR